MIPAFNNITEDGFALLEDILNHPNHVPADFFFSEPTVDGQLKLLISSELVSINEAAELNITALGRTALKEYEHEQEHQRLLKEQRDEELASFKSIAEAAKLQAKLAEDAAQRAIADAKDAKRDALFAKIVSVIAIIAPILYDFLATKLPMLFQALSELSAK